MTEVVFSPAVTTYLLKLDVLGQVDHIHCDLCGVDTLPPTKVRDAAVCPHDAELTNEVDYQLGFGAEVCDDCAAVLIPALQGQHVCEGSTFQ